MIEAIRRRQAYLPAGNTGSMGQNVASGTAWSGIALLGTTAVQLVRSVIFARLLAPADFGVLGLANVFTQFVLIFASFGLNASVVYMRDLDRQDLGTVWWSNLVIDTTVALLCAGAALVNGRVTGNWQMSWVVCLLAAQFVVTAVGSVSVALMRRQFLFKQIAIIKIANAVITMLAALFFVAVLEWGVYGLVAGMIAGNLATTIHQFISLPWLPSFSYSRHRLRQHLNYGGWFLGLNVVTYINGNLDRTLVGTRLDTTQLGYYEYASNIPLTIATQLSGAINSVLFPAFSSLQNNLAEVGHLLRKVYRYNAILIYPLLAGMAMVAEDFVLALYGDKWLPIIPVLRVFCLVGMVRIVVNPLYPLCNGLGRTRMPFVWSAILLPFNLVALWVAIHYFGLLGAVTARVVVPLLTCVTLGRAIFRQVGFRWRWLFLALVPALTCSAFMSVAVEGVRQFGFMRDLETLTRLLIQVMVGGATYAGAMVVLFRGDVRMFQDQARRFVHRG